MPDPDANAFTEPRSSVAMPTQPGENRLILLIDLDADPINGSLQTADGRSRRFSGWIGLAAALNAVRNAEARGADHHGSRAVSSGGTAVQEGDHSSSSQPCA